MIVHFIASKTSIKRDYSYLKGIVDIVKSLGHTLARDWVEEEYEFVTAEKKHESIDWRTVNKENMDALARADVVVAEVSAKSFSTGFQVATAIQQKKPVLMLARNDALAGTFGSGIASDFVKSENYATTDDLSDIISDFINENNIQSKDLRFNFFIDRQIYNYLRWASFKTGKTKAKILREMVLKEIKRSSDY